MISADLTVCCEVGGKVGDGHLSVVFWRSNGVGIEYTLQCHAEIVGVTELL
jgi:hypothetical protein